MVDGTIEKMAHGNTAWKRLLCVKSTCGFESDFVVRCSTDFGTIDLRGRGGWPRISGPLDALDVLAGCSVFEAVLVPGIRGHGMDVGSTVLVRLFSLGSDSWVFFVMDIATLKR